MTTTVPSFQRDPRLRIDRGLVLKRAKHLEEDLHLTFLLRDLGKVRILAKGAQRMRFKCKALTEPFIEADFHLYLPPNGIYARLIGGQLRKTHPQFRLNYSVFQTVCRCCEVVDLLIPYRSPVPDIYDLLDEALGRLNQGAGPDLEWIRFVALLLDRLGHGNPVSVLTGLVAPGERGMMSRILTADGPIPASPPPLSDSSLRRCLAALRSRLDPLLPVQLKSEGLNQSLHNL